MSPLNAFSFTPALNFNGRDQSTYTTIFCQENNENGFYFV
ncbi:hypothetical protein Nizo1839_2277 [Lactiplantibacillus plantarum]|nr:hypothetical protein Nizo1839_2277 [Lactiplantibacillus plantarum]